MSANCAHIENAPDAPATDRRFPVAAGILFGLGLGVFFDGIVLHQILQWHHMVTSAGFPADSVENIEINTFFDGLFHASSYVFVVSGLLLLWRSAHKSSPVVGREDARRNDPDGIRALQPGGGHGTMNHHLLGLHHVNETVPRDQWIYWDAGFLLWGAAMLVGGWFLLKAGRRQSPGERSTTRSSWSDCSYRLQP